MSLLSESSVSTLELVLKLKNMFWDCCCCWQLLGLFFGFDSLLSSDDDDGGGGSGAVWGVSLQLCLPL